MNVNTRSGKRENQHGPSDDPKAREDTEALRLHSVTLTDRLAPPPQSQADDSRP